MHVCGRAYVCVCVCVCAIFVCGRSGLSQAFIPYSTSLIHRVFQGSRFHDTSWWRLRSVLDWLEPSSEGFTHAFEHPLITVTRRCKAKIRFCFVRPACFVFFSAKATFLHVQKNFCVVLNEIDGRLQGGLMQFYVLFQISWRSSDMRLRILVCVQWATCTHGLVFVLASSRWHVC